MNFIERILGNKWKEDIVLSSIPLWKYENEMPIANAAGCLINYKGKIFILSIAHASIAESEWNVEVKAVDEINGELTTVYQPVNMQCLSEFRLNPKTNDFTEPKIVDFTYKTVPDNFTSTDCLGFINKNELLQSKRTIFSPNFDYEPSKDKKYGFYGKVKFNGVKGKFMDFEHRLESELEYIGKENEFLVFKLPHKYGSHKNYIGCSGAPIIDEENNVTALVSYGLKSTNCIYGIDISKYRAALEIETLN